MTATLEPTTLTDDQHDEQVEITQEMATGVPRTPRQLVRQTKSDFGLLGRTKYGVTPMLLLFAIDLVQVLDTSIAGFAFPEIRREFNASLVELTMYSKVFSIFGIGLIPLVGVLNDRWRRTHLVGLSCVISGALSMATGFVPTLPLYSLVRTFDSFGEGVGNLPTGTLLYDYYPIEARAKVISLRHVIFAIAGLITGPFVGFMVKVQGWRWCYIVVSVPLILSGLLATRLREPVRGYWERMRSGADEDLAEEEQPPLKMGEAFRTLLAVKTLRRTLILTSLFGIGSTGFNFLFQFYLLEEFHLDPFQRSLINLPVSIIGLGFMVAGGVVADGLIKRDPRRVMLLKSSLSIVAVAANIIVVLLPNLALLILTGAVISLANQLLLPATATVSSLIIPARLRGQGLSLLALIFFPTSIIFGFIPAYVGDNYGLRTGLLIFAPINLLAAVLSISAAKFVTQDMRAAVASANATNEYRRAKAAGLIRLLLVRDVDVAYDGVQVLFNVDVTVDQGETIALLGTNGAGKSTLLKAISGIQEADNGAIFFDGTEITHKPPYEIARLGIVHMPGGRAVFPTLTVRENLDLARLQLDDDNDAADRLEQAFTYFPQLRERLDQAAGSLSGGEQQMVGLTQALLWQPRLLMIDELSLGLSPAVVGQLIEVIRTISATGTTIILVEQSVNVALTIAERAIFMEKGEVRFDGPTETLLSRPDIMRAVYLKGSGALAAAPRRTAADVNTERMRPILECEGISVGFGGVQALQNVSFTLHEGEALGLIGPNGAGKTTLFDIISGFLPPDRGRIVYDGVDITRLTPAQRAEKKLVRRFQDAKLFASLTVFEAICVALDQKLDVRSPIITALQLPSVRRSEGRVKARADRLIELFDLGAYRDKFVSDLSTGLRRVVDLACVLAAEPRVLLLDEPSSGIAQAEAESLGPLLRRIRFETGCSLLIIEHDMPLIRAVSDELLALVLGQVVTRGPASEVLEHPIVVDAYLGTSEEALNRSGLLKR